MASQKPDFAQVEMAETQNLNEYNDDTVVDIGIGKTDPELVNHLKVTTDGHVSLNKFDQP